MNDEKLTEFIRCPCKALDLSKTSAPFEINKQLKLKYET